MQMLEAQIRYLGLLLARDLPFHRRRRLYRAWRALQARRAALVAARTPNLACRW